jgi:hypothetical protein
VVWIDLTKQSYGIHDSPDRSRIGKGYSHGCIRLTNWDALDLARRVRKGTPVDFVDKSAPPAAKRRQKRERAGSPHLLGNLSCGCRRWCRGSTPT